MQPEVESAAAAAGISTDQARAFLEALRDPGAVVLSGELDHWIEVAGQDVALGPSIIGQIWSRAIDRSLSTRS